MIVKELKRLFTRKMIHRRVFSSLMAMMLVITSVIHPINMVPVYATGNWLQVDYQEKAKSDVEIYVQAEETSFEPGETVTLDLFVQNNSSEEYTDFGISFKDNKDAFAEAEFILTDDCGEAYITEKGSVTNLYLAPGETKALQFEGTLYGGLDVLNRKEITFLCGGYDVNGEAVTTKTEFPFTVGLFNELSIDFTNGTELIPDENNTLEITIGFNDIGYYYDTDVATDSDAKVSTDSNADLATDSDADLATDSNADIDEDYVFDLTNVTLDLETVGVKFEKVKLEEASINEENGTITALVSYKVDEDAEAGEYFGTVEANVKNGKKVYLAQTGFQFEVEEVTNSTFKKSGLFTAELDNFTVNVEVAKGAFDEKVELVVTELEEDSEAFKTAEEAMEASEREFDGMMALDICFINEDGEEVEPNEGYSVQVSIEMKAEVLPEGIDTESLMVHHIAETTTDDVQAEVELVVEDVADTADATDGIVEVKEDAEEAVVAVEFSVESFSTFTITWNSNKNTLTVVYAKSADDEAEISLDNMKSGEVLANTFDLANCAPDVAKYTNTEDGSVTKYTFSEAVLKIGNSTYKYTDRSQAIKWDSNKLQYYVQSGFRGEWREIPNKSTLYLIYEPAVKTENTKDFISITLKDFDANEWAGPDQTGQIDYDKRFVIGGSKSGWMNSWTNNSEPNNPNSLGVVQGIVENTLSSSKYPVLDFDSSKKDETQYTLEKFFTGNDDKTYKGCNYLFQKDEDGYYSYDSSENFAQLDTLTKEFAVYNSPRVVSNAGSDPQFIPFNNKGVASSAANYYFGMTVEFDFIMPKEGKVNGEDMIFSFAGDDDVWVFIDNVLVLDMGGVHLSNEGYINFATGNVHVDKVYKIGKIDNNSEPDNRNLKDIYDSSNPAGDIKWTTNANNQTIYSDYTKHTLKFFYMERGAGGSNCKIEFNLPVVPQKSLTVAKELVAKELVGKNDNTTSNNEDNVAVREYVKSTITYKFRVVKASNPSELYVKPKTEFTLLENGKSLGTRNVDSEGFFYLKAGQSAQFNNMLGINGNEPDDYVVQEFMPEKTSGQYQGVQFVINGTGGKVETGDEDQLIATFDSFTSGPLKNEETQYVVFNNVVDTDKLSGLKITKKIAPGSEINDSVSDFKIQIKFGDVPDPENLNPVPSGTKYTIVDENNKEVREGIFGTDDNGIVKLKDGQSLLMVDGILAGTYYYISEVDTGGYTPSYCTESEDGDTISISESGVSGSFILGESVYVTIVNSDYDFITNLGISKETVGFTEQKDVEEDSLNTFNFNVTPCQATINNDNKVSISSEGKTYVGSTIKVDAKTDGTFTDEIILGIRTDEKNPTGPYYFLVEEEKGNIDFVEYDKTVYLVGVTITDGEARVSSINTINTDGILGSVASETLEFVNHYNYTTHITIDKNVAGNFGDVTREFTFSVTVDGAPYVDGADKDGKYKLSHSTEAIRLDNIPLDSEVVITEEDGAGYIVSADVSNAKFTLNGNVLAFVASSKSGHDVVFTNTKNAPIDTGISMDTLPYILIMLAVIGGIAFTIIRRRKDDELD